MGPGNSRSPGGPTKIAYLSRNEVRELTSRCSQPTLQLASGFDDFIDLATNIKGTQIRIGPMLVPKLDFFVAYVGGPFVSEQLGFGYVWDAAETFNRHTLCDKLQFFGEYVPSTLYGAFDNRFIYVSYHERCCSRSARKYFHQDWRCDRLGSKSTLAPRLI